MKAIVQFSLGAGSAEVAYLAVEKYGLSSVTLLTANTLKEHPDCWRFGREVHAFLNRPKWVVVTDGRTPMQAGRDEGIIPNNRMPVCSKRLKQAMCRKWMDQHTDPATDVVLIGLDRDEDIRVDAISAGWQPWSVEYPLRDDPRLPDKNDVLGYWDGRGIALPVMYEDGFPHANCHGACVRGGQKQWRRVLEKYPDTYREWEIEEEESRAQVGDYSILRDRSGGTLKPLTLRNFRRRLGVNWDDFDKDDDDVCGCNPFDGEVEVSLNARR